MTRMYARCASAGFALAVCAVLAPPGAAQELEQVVVTAERRATTLQQTPISIAAFSAESMQLKGIETVEDVASFTPNLDIKGSRGTGNVSPTYQIRGLSGGGGATGERSAAMYIDGVYMPRTSGPFMNVLDIERIEVLRGPQGTLYGRNTIGGAINIITRKPDGGTGGYVGVDVGDYGTVNLRGAATAPLLDDTLSGRIAFVSRQRDGLYDNLATGEEGNNVDTQGFRGSLRYTPTDRTQVDFSADWIRAEQDGVLKSVIVDEPGTLYILKDFFRVTFPGQEDDIRSSRAGLHGAQGVEQYGATLTIEHGFPAMDLVSITGYRTEDSHHAEDNDRAPERSGHVGSTQDTSSFSQELRLVSTTDGAWDWTAGVYWFHESGDRVQWRYSDFFGPGGLLGPGSPEMQDSTTTFAQGIETDSFAVFGQATYAFTDRLSATLGGRYTEETKDYDIDAFAVPNDPGGDDWSLFIPQGPFAVSDSETWSEFTPKVSLQYSLSDRVNSYVSYAEGFKSGGYNGGPDTAASVVPFEPEHAKTYELGLKGRLFDDQMSVNLAAFFTDFTDLQLQGFDPVTGSPITNNAAAAEISGVELEIFGVLAQGFHYNIGASWLDHQFKDYFIEVFDPSIVGGPPFRVVDKEGDRIGLVPDYNYHIGLAYEWAMGGGHSITLGGDLAAADKTITVFNTLWSDAYEVFDVRLAWDSPDNWSAELWVRNAFDEVYYRGGGPVPDLNPEVSRLGLVAEPRIVGVSFDYRFGD